MEEVKNKGNLYFNTSTDIEVKIDPSAQEGKKLLSCINLFDGQTLGEGSALFNALIYSPEPVVSENGFTIEAGVEVSDVEWERINSSVGGGRYAIIFVATYVRTGQPARIIQDIKRCLLLFHLSGNGYFIANNNSVNDTICKSFTDTQTFKLMREAGEVKKIRAIGENVSEEMTGNVFGTFELPSQCAWKSLFIFW